MNNPLTDPLVSVIVPCYNEERYIRSFLESMLRQDYPAGRLEIFIIDGMSSDHTREIIGEYTARYPHIRLLLNERRYVPFALNLAIRQAQGEVIVRMDAHSGYPGNYISRLTGKLLELGAENVGGVWLTTPANDSAMAGAIAVAQSSVFGVGNAHYRLGTREIRQVDTVPFGCFPKSVFDRIGLFDEELLRNQDDEFNARIIEHGGTIYLVPDVVIVYYARATVRSMARMFFQYAWFKPLVNRKLKKPATIRQFIPPLFVLFLALGWMGLFISPWLSCLYAAGAGTYMIANLYFTCKSAVEKRRLSLVWYLPWLFLVQHLSYGTGYLAGIVKFVLAKRPQVTLASSR